MKTPTGPTKRLVLTMVLAVATAGGSAAVLRHRDRHSGEIRGLVSAVQTTSTSTMVVGAPETTLPEAPTTTEVPPERSECPTPAPPKAGAGERTVTVFFTCDKDGTDATPVPVARVVPADAPARAALDQLLAGPTADERAAGLRSFFSAATASMLRSATVDATGYEVVDLGDLRRLISDAGTSAGAPLLLRQLDATVFQAPGVRAVQYRIEGSCETFFEWLQLDCQDRVRATG